MIKRHSEKRDGNSLSVNQSRTVDKLVEARMITFRIQLKIRFTFKFHAFETFLFSLLKKYTRCQERSTKLFDKLYNTNGSLNLNVSDEDI